VKAVDNFYYGEIVFNFDYQYSYNNYGASGIDSLVKFSTILVFFFIIWTICCWFVKQRFLNELRFEILKTSQEIQMADGALPLPKQQSLKNCADQLSFSRLFFNQFQIKRLEQLILEAREQNILEFYGRLDKLQAVD